jgi:heat shock protein HtpX
MARTHHRRDELFPPDRGLQARMLAAMVATPLSIVVGVVLVALLLPLKALIAVGAALLVGGGFALHRLRKSLRAEVVLRPDEGSELMAIVDRLCVTADLPRPEIALEPDAQPNSWVVDLPGRPPRLHLTDGLLRLLEPVEIEAVVAHELAHVAHRDATVMTVVALPADALAGEGHRFSGIYGVASLVPVAIGMLARTGSSSLSRHRELAADRSAAALTGKPSALASALLKVSGSLKEIPKKDLREAAGFQALNLLPVGKDRRGPWRTHPSVEKRVAALERMERRLAGARRAGPRD